MSMNENRRPYTDVKSVESQRNDLAAEEFPDGPYGSGLLSESLGKSKPWRIDQRSPNAYGYENRELHEGMYRDYPGEDDFPDAIDEP
ncbi:hypothetical protein [Paenibacillus montanisoli]|uniref:Cytosolic protein n=1 Tax=Paenibacillus montanisoli TaxID=2081970 RepID=A0A328U8Z5_9BACL|nr:hypothetical protein [Paenibacillus montanisoli]RAP77375.1 hypothetical protein DL346_02485 [Paenibacillus montanisoli]